MPTCHQAQFVNSLASLCLMVSLKTEPTMATMLRAAKLLDLDAAPLSNILEIYRIGQGARSIHYFRMASERDGIPGNVLQQNKLATLEKLKRVGLPTSNAIRVNDYTEAVAAAEKVGIPCVVKPISAGKGAGVTAGISTELMLRQAVEQAARRGGFPIIVENYIEGDDHRLLVINDQLLWVYRRRAPLVVGDGKANVAELIARENSRREQAPAAHQNYLKRLSADPQILFFLQATYGFDLNSIPRRGQRVKLGDVANLARGGTLEDVTTKVHPDNRELAIAAARALRLKNVGIDFITNDIAKSWREVPSAIIEVNATPGISGIGDACLALRTAFPRLLSGRIPVFLVIGDEAYRDEVARGLLAGLSEKSLYARSVDCSDGEDAHAAVEGLMDDSQVEAIVVCCSLVAVARLRIPLRRCDVLITASAVYRDVLPSEHTIVGDVSRDELWRVAAMAAAPYCRCQGGARPALEWLTSLSEAPDHLILRIWRLRAISSDWFWSQVFAHTGSREGMIGPSDLLTATIQLADAHLASQGEPLTGMQIKVKEIDGAWETPYLHVRVDFGRARAKKIEAALRNATDMINELVA